ncbi:unnamed protein product [Phaedon cochleariae]|uniref:Uncharacterized protein n=1 Tax=Phaedon cochleariae TaxID=80249 RepID=A0A9N9SK64_PHACE|nr:unnamed protein product [Phaedon cochleariae]
MIFPIDKVGRLKKNDDKISVQELLDKMAELLPENIEPYTVRRMHKKYFSDDIMILRQQDIQEFYELTLLDENKSVQEKTAETIRIANKWEANDGPIIPAYTNNEYPYMKVLTFNAHTVTVSSKCDMNYHQELSTQLLVHSDPEYSNGY